MKEQTQTGLLEYIAEQTGCDFLSDLHCAKWKKVQEALLQANTKTFSLEEWNDAAKYLTGEKRCFRTSTEAVNFLLNRKNNERGEDGL